MIPYLSVYDSYTPAAKEIAHKIKGETISGEPCGEKAQMQAIAIAASNMARLVPKGSIIVPIPGHHGYATDTLLLAREIARYAKVECRDILKGKDRESSHHAKLNGSSVNDFGFYLTEEVNAPIVYVDNIIASGATARAVNEVKAGTFLVYVCVNSIKGFVKRNAMLRGGIVRQGRLNRLVF